MDIPHYNCDVVLSLLNTNTPKSLAKVEKIIGRPITYCPPAVPPWPPKPVIIVSKPKVRKVQPGTQCKKLDQVRIGWTLDQIIERLGVTRRDVKHWIKRRYLEVST